MKIIPLVLAMLLLSSCSQEETGTTEVFPPKLTFVEPEEPTEEEEEVGEEGEEEEGEPEIARHQVYPELTEASSFLPSTATETFGASSTFDGDEYTVWAENGSGFGAGEWVEHRFAWPEEVQEIWIYNGHGESPNRYAHITEVSIRFSTGEDRVYNITPGWNTIVLDSPIYTTSVRVTILNGDTRYGEDACIAEIKLFNLSGQEPTEQVGKETVLKKMGALGDCSNITPAQAAAFALELQHVIDWAETTSQERIDEYGAEYGKYTAEALLFDGGGGVPVLYYDYDFAVVEELFVTQTDLVVWDGKTAKRSFFEVAGQNTNINWILPGLLYQRKEEYYFGLTEFDVYGSGSFGLIAMMGFDKGYPRDVADYVAFISHSSRGAYTYEAELADYLKMPYLSSFPTQQLETLVGDGGEAYFEFNGTNFFDKQLSYNSTDVNGWFNAIRQARVDAGYVQVTKMESGDAVMAGLMTLASGFYDEAVEIPPVTTGQTGTQGTDSSSTVVPFVQPDSDYD